MNRETLRTLGLTEEQIDAVMADHGRSMQQVQSRLTAAETQNQDLQTQLDNSSNSEEIQQLTERAEQAETQVATLEGQLSQINIDNLVNTALTEAGATDLEYARFKLGEVELNEDGSVKDLESKIKDLQTNLPDYFEAQKDESDDSQDDKDPLGGFTHVKNDLKDGKQSEPNATEQMIAAFTSDLPQTIDK